MTFLAVSYMKYCSTSTQAHFLAIVNAKERNMVFAKRQSVYGNEIVQIVTLYCKLTSFYINEAF